MIEHEASGASGSGDRSGIGRAPRRARQTRTFATGCLLVVALLAVIFWRQVAILWCWGVARAHSAPDVVGWNCAALADLGPSSLPALARLSESPEIQRAWSARTAIDLLHEKVPEANAPIHDLLLQPGLHARVAAATVLVASGAHDATGIPAALEGLGSTDADARFFAAFFLSFFPGDRFEKEVPDAPHVFHRMVRALAEALTDPRRLWVHRERTGMYLAGEWATVSTLAETALKRLDPDLAASKEAREAALGGDAAKVFTAARERRSAFFEPVPPARGLK